MKIIFLLLEYSLSYLYIIIHLLFLLASAQRYHVRQQVTHNTESMLASAWYQNTLVTFRVSVKSLKYKIRCSYFAYFKNVNIALDKLSVTQHVNYPSVLILTQTMVNSYAQKHSLEIASTISTWQQINIDSVKSLCDFFSKYFFK